MAENNKILIGNDGYVELLETFGDDLTIVNAARVSFNKESTELNDKDKSLINYLAKNNHVSPFFHPQLRFRIKMPIFIAREWYRHTIGFARNEVSRRYVDDIPQVWIPNEFRERDKNLKQGSKKETIQNNEEILEIYQKAVNMSLSCYEILLKHNVAPEMARTILPQSMYTEFIETGSLSAYARLCQLRLDPHAQLEIQEYANAVSKLCLTKFPVGWPALV